MSDEDKRMTVDRFNELLQGPLHHPMVEFTITRLTLALLHVVSATGAAGAAALEEWCEEREQEDERDYDAVK